VRRVEEVDCQRGLPVQNALALEDFLACVHACQFYHQSGTGQPYVQELAGQMKSVELHE
jgi:hypothetical protein